MEQLRQTNSQKINLNRILKVKNTLLDLKKRKLLEKDETREDKIIKYGKHYLKEMDTTHSTHFKRNVTHAKYKKPF